MTDRIPWPVDMRGWEKVGMTLAEAKSQAEEIKQMECKICGERMTVWGDKIALIVAIRNSDRYCPSCRTALDWVVKNGGTLPKPSQPWTEDDARALSFHGEDD